MTTTGNRNSLPRHLDEAFRANVAHAYRRQLLGQPAGVLEALATGASAIDVGLRPGDMAFPGGIYRFQAGGRHLHLFMTTLRPASCARALARSLGAGVVAGPSSELPCRSWQGAGLHFDQLTDVTVVHAFAAERDAAGAREAMARMLEVLVAAEALAALGIDVLEGPSEART